MYLAVVIDLASRRVVGWSIDKRMQQALVIRALMMAIAMRKPQPGLIHHSDRGSQYTGKDYQTLLESKKMTCSMIRKGKCRDNSSLERLFRSLKSEWMGDQLYHTRAQAIVENF